MSLYVLAFLIGVIAGLTPPAVPHEVYPALGAGGTRNLPEKAHPAESPF
jgi:hypothetical protein